jgi:hypothetical protein
MSTVNVYFSHGTRNEQNLVEDLIIESLRIYGQEFFYIPRKLVSKDEILGEDRLSEFKASFPVEMYFENVDSFGGQGAFIQKFGLMMEQSATLVVARRRWEQLVGRYGMTIIPTRPNEGDLIYFPLTKGLFEIKFVQHQDPFYQLGKLYVYKLQVELFQYSSERIDTGVKEVDVFETLKTFSTNTTRNDTGRVTAINVINNGFGYATPPTVNITGNGRGATAEAILGTGDQAGKIIAINVLQEGTSYNSTPTVTISGGGGFGASAVAVIDINIDKTESYGDNNSFKQQASDVLFSESNPFGEIDFVGSSPSAPIAPQILSADSTSVTSDNSIITVDIQ